MYLCIGKTTITILLWHFWMTLGICQKKIVHLTTDSIPDNFQKLVNNIRNDISANTSTSILSDFRLHVTLGRIAEAEADVDDIGFLIDEIDFMPINLTLNEVEYRVFRGRSLYKATLN